MYFVFVLNERLRRFKLTVSATIKYFALAENHLFYLTLVIWQIRLLITFSKPTKEEQKQMNSSNDFMDISSMANIGPLVERVRS